MFEIHQRFKVHFLSELHVSFKVLEYLQKMKTLKMTFSSWSEFCDWTKVKAKYVFKQNDAFKRNTSLFCFFMFLRANVFQVKLDNISFIF